MERSLCRQSRPKPNLIAWSNCSPSTPVGWRLRRFWHSLGARHPSVAPCNAAGPGWSRSTSISFRIVVTAACNVSHGGHHFPQTRSDTPRQAATLSIIWSTSIQTAKAHRIAAWRHQGPATNEVRSQFTCLLEASAPHRLEKQLSRRQVPSRRPKRFQSLPKAAFASPCYSACNAPTRRQK